MKEILASLFDIDRSDPSTGIKIRLKPGTVPGSRGAGELQGRAELPCPPGYSSAPPAPYGIHIANGRIVRESRHPDSAYRDWAPITGPAHVEVGAVGNGRKKKSEPPIALDTLEYVVVDVETTGGGVNRGHRITEIAIVRVDADGKPTHEYTTLVNPGRSIPYEISKLTNISQDMVRGAPRFEEIAQDVRQLLGGRVFVAHNAGFDWNFVHGELVRTTGKPLLGRRLCTVRLARKVVPEVRRRTLDSLQYFFDVHNEARHRAYGDARATAIIFQRLLDRVWEREIDSWQGLEQLLRRAPKQRKKRSALPQPMEDA